MKRCDFCGVPIREPRAFYVKTIGVKLCPDCYKAYSDEKGSNTPGLMTREEYYSRHEHDGTGEIAAFCFAVIALAVVLAAIFA